MEKLDAVNNILLSMGQRTVTDIATPHPLKDAIIAQLEYHRKLLLRKGQYFNVRTMTLYPNESNQIVQPSSILALWNPRTADFINKLLTDTATGSTTFANSASVDAYVNLEFNALPEVASEMLVAVVLCEMYLAEYGDDNTYRQHMLRREEAKAALRREEIRRMPSAASTNPIYQRIVRAVRGDF